MGDPIRHAPLPLGGRRVLVVGLGRTGIAMARWAMRRGASVRACDRRDGLECPADLASVEWIAGEDGPALLEGMDVVVPLSLIHI